MESQWCILFCENPLDSKKVDEDYQEEYIAAKENGLKTLLYSYEDLTSDNFTLCTRRIVPTEELCSVIYRGWMLTPNQYTVLYQLLLSKNYKLINTVQEYQNCHYLPDSLKYIKNWTPKTIFEKYHNETSIELLIEKAKVFKENQVILKDYVKSEKHDWETACFVPNASDSLKLKHTINKLIELRGKHLNEGIVIREYIALNHLTIHSKSGMPLTEEYRLFFLNKKLIGIYDYWEEGNYEQTSPETTLFEDLATQIESNFFCMDIARKQDDNFTIIELGDGQVAGLPDTTNRNAFYKHLKKCL